MAEQMISSAQQSPEKQQTIFTISGNPPRSSTNNPIVVSALTPKGLEKSDTQHPGERQVMHQDILPSFLLLPNPQLQLQQTLPMGKVLPNECNIFYHLHRGVVLYVKHFVLMIEKSNF